MASRQDKVLLRDGSWSYASFHKQAHQQPSQPSDSKAVSHLWQGKDL